MIDNRHEKLAINNAKSTAIVDSMFPSNVRDRLYAEEGGGDIVVKVKKERSKRRRHGSKQHGKEAEGSEMGGSDKDVSHSKTIPEGSGNRECYPEMHRQFAQSGSQRLKNYFDTGGVGAGDIGHTDPIADLFPHCTVLFADIAGACIIIGVDGNIKRRWKLTCFSLRIHCLELRSRTLSGKLQAQASHDHTTVRSLLFTLHLVCVARFSLFWRHCTRNLMK